MNDSLVPYQAGFPETKEQSATRQFYEWERRGRGWLVCALPVEIEPPLRPFYLIGDQSAPAIDDGRHESFFTRWFGGGNNQTSRQQAESRKELAELKERLAEMDAPSVCEYDEEFAEFQLVLPKDLKITKPVAERLLLSLSYCRCPISFEVIGTGREIVVQMAAAEGDAAQLAQQLRAHVPQMIVNQTSSTLSDAWHSGGERGLIVDFGLAREFMLPLETIDNLEVDPLVAITGALSCLAEDEIGVFQVLFQKTRQPWAEEMLDAVRSPEGEPFFCNAPEMIPLAKEKTSRPLFACVIRVAAKSRGSERSLQIARNVGAALSQLANPISNELIPLTSDGYYYGDHEQGLLARQSHRLGMILNAAELALLVHPPSASVRAEKLVRESELTKEAPSAALYHELILGDNLHRGELREVSLSAEQRTRHLHLIGASGSGKSTLMLNLIKQDLENDQGLCVIDPHGDLIDDVLAGVPENRIGDVVLFDPSDADFPVGFNILKANSELEKTILSSDLIATFRRLSTSWGDVMDAVLANALLAFVESERCGTLFELKRFLVEKEFRGEFLHTVRDEAIRYFWRHEFPLIAGKPQSSILIRLDSFLRQRLIRNIVCQRESKIDFRRVMDERKILLIKLSQGLIGEENAYLLGTLLVSKLYQTALSRQDSSNRPYFWLYLDEFHHFITPSMESVLSGVRKYNLGLTLAHQEFRQLNSRSLDVAAGVLSNCYTRICFRLGDSDAERFAGGFSFFDQKALQNLGVGQAIGRIERAEYDFNLATYRPEKVPKDVAEQRKAAIISHSRAQYATSRSEVESQFQFAGPAQPEEDQKPPEPPKAKAQSKTEKTQAASASSAANEHRYLQGVVKRLGEKCGFVATIERPVFAGAGKIDVALESDEMRIACEIASTNTVEYELQNIQKCLAAGFEVVAVISSDKKHLEQIRRSAETIMTSEQLLKVRFLAPDSFRLFLETVLQAQRENTSSDQPATDHKVKGYTIKTEVVESSGGTARKQNLLGIIKGALKRRGKE